MSVAFNKEDYVARIANANGVQLTIITYEIAIHYMEQAKSAHATDIDDFQRFIKSAQPSVESLMDTLDMQYDISKSLMSLYIYVNKLLINAYFSKKAEPLDEAISVMQEMLSAWLEAEKAETEDTVLMENAQQIFAGLTYKNGNLTEYIKEDENRGYKA